MSKHTRSGPSSKPSKPYEGFPLFAHPSGQWAKKIKGRLCYFGSWRTDPEGEAALETFNREWPYLKEGRTPPPAHVGNGCTLRTLANDFLNAKAEKLEAGELSPRTFRDYYATCERLISHFGKDRRVDDLRPDDFRSFRAKLAKIYGTVSLKNEIGRCRVVFNHAFQNELIDKPVSYGQAFAKPSAKALRRARNEAGPKLFEHAELLAILKEADAQLKAMVLLGINCGFGNTDVASLPLKAVNLETGWISFPRPKTEIPRRIPLWKETIDALKAALAARPKPADASADRLVFLTRQGRPWVRVKGNAKGDADNESEPTTYVPIDPLGQRFGRLLRKLKINGRRGLGFYTLRHTFETVAGESRDQVAVDAVMGHVDSSMAATYRHRISDERLRVVVDTVRSWLFGEGGAA